jgi:hypothetical protein
MRRIFCTVLVAAAAAASAQADIRPVKPLDQLAFRHEAKSPDKGPRDPFSDCAAFIAAARAKGMNPLILTEKCADASQGPEFPPAESPPAGQQPKINGPSIVTGPGACSVIGEVGRSC